MSREIGLVPPTAAGRRIVPGGTANRDSAETRFWVKVDRTDDCWVWRGARNAFGYGIFKVEVGSEKKEMAHRWSFKAAGGDIPDGLTLDHLCENKLCVRPDHLEPCTRGENAARAKRGERNYNAQLTADDVREIRRRYARGESQRSLARSYGVSQGSVWGVVHGKTWRHVA